MSSSPNLRDLPLHQLVRLKMRYARDPVLPLLEDKFHAKLRSVLLGVPTVPLLFECQDATGLRGFLERKGPLLTAFVVKTNHGCGDVCILRRTGPEQWRLQRVDGSLDGTYEEVASAVLSLMTRWLHRLHKYDEWALSQIWPRRVIVEPYLELNDDYKVCVSRGKSVFVFCLSERFSERGRVAGVFDTEWRFLGAHARTIRRYGKVRAERLVREHFPAPPDLGLLYSLAERMTPRRLDIHRVDFYRAEGGGYLLGEMTGYPWGGLVSFEDDAELRMGRLITAQIDGIYDQAGVVVASKEWQDDEQGALAQDYFTVANGATIVLHRHASSSQEDIDALLDAQRRRPGTLNRAGLSWTWDQHYVMGALEARLAATGPGADGVSERAGLPARPDGGARRPP
jgi:hypothetical protein